MNPFLPVCLIVCALSGAAKAATIWQEDFSSCTNAGITGAGAVNYPAGITNWSLDVSACAALNPGSGSAGDYFMATAISGGRMEAVNIDGEAVWSSAVIDISGCTNIELSAAASEIGSSASTNKYVKLFYRLNGGAETAFAVNSSNAGNWGSATAAQSNLYGSTVQIVARVNNPNTGDKSIFDTVTVSGDRPALDLPPVSESSRLAGYFHGWTGDTVFKFADGHFRQQSAAGRKTVSPALRQPYVTVTNVSGQLRMIVSNVTGYAVVAPLTVTESSVTNTFSGLHYQNVYRLADGTAWKQVSFETAVSNAASVTVWRWIKNGRQMLRFIDRSDAVIGTCTAEAAALPADTAVHSRIDGYFHGFGYGGIFHLTDGSWWKQISFERSAAERHDPDVLVWNEDGAVFIEMPGEDGRIAVERLNVQQESSVTNTFTGLHHGNLYRLADGEDRLQLSFENISTNVAHPNVMLWTDGAQTHLLVRDTQDRTIGTCTVAAPETDADRDGLSNAAEVLAGLDPLDSQSNFGLRQTDRNVLSWQAAAGRIYTIEWTPSLADPFQMLEDGIAAPRNCWTDAVHSAETKGFYRVRVRLAD